ncbi:nucleoside monophosphate kinase [Candidatus Gottesmanbacteria bacterium]|nr:nucleoside monophosphate kinase [Candidatus Gottesmanbacteria bacterium]
MHLIIYGSEGSGKGTQANLISEKYQLGVITSGDLVRNEALTNNNHLGKICKDALESGKYVPDSEMFSLWGSKLAGEEAKKGFVLDGFPRNVIQAEFLLTKVKESGYAIDRVIYLKISDEEAIKRLSIRKRQLFAGSSILHDTPERIKSRLSVYREKEKDLLDFFRLKKILTEINGDQTIEKIFQDIVVSLQHI